MGIYVGPAPVIREHFSTVEEYIDAWNWMCDIAESHNVIVLKKDLVWEKDFEAAMEIL